MNIRLEEETMAKKTEGKAAAHDGGKRELVELKVRANFKTFGFRPLVNGDKLQLVFEADWKHLPKGTMAKVEKVVQLMGELAFLEAEVQKEPKEDDPDQGHLPLGSEEIE